MNSDIKDVIRNPPKILALASKEKEQKHEQFVKNQVTKRPFDLKVIKNKKSIVLDTHSQGGNMTTEQGDSARGDETSMKKKKSPMDDPGSVRKKRVDDDLQVFTHFLLGKSEMDQNEKEEMLKQQNDRELMKLLEMKEN